MEPISWSIEYGFVRDHRSRKCGYAFLEWPFLEDMSVQANLLSLELFEWIMLSRKRLMDLSEYFTIEHLLSSRISHLSSGQRERVSLVRAFLHDPAIVFIDEPWANLDDTMTEKVRDFLIEESKNWRTIVLSTHDPTWKKYTENVILLPLHEN